MYCHLVLPWDSTWETLLSGGLVAIMHNVRTCHNMQECHCLWQHTYKTKILRKTRNPIHGTSSDSLLSPYNQLSCPSLTAIEGRTNTIIIINTVCVFHSWRIFNYKFLIATYYHPCIFIFTELHTQAHTAACPAPSCIHCNRVGVSEFQKATPKYLKN